VSERTRSTLPSLPGTIARHAAARIVDAALETTVALSFGRPGHALRSRLGRWPAPEAPGRRIVVTGTTSGLGLAAAGRLLAAGAQVVAVARNPERTEAMIARLTDTVGRAMAARLVPEVADLDDLASVRALAARLADGPAIDALVHNAGALLPAARTLDGHDRTYQVHVLAPFLLTALTLPALVRATDPRVITVTSGGMYTQRLDVARLLDPDDASPAVTYARAKRAQVVATAEWERRFGGHGIGFHAVHPGWADTPGLERSLPGFHRVVGPLLRDADAGADGMVHLACAPGADLPSGRLWLDRRPRLAHRVPWTLSDRAETDRLWATLCRDSGVVPVVPGAASGPTTPDREETRP
jgi:dehydrogenase/reductase SDR family member 12